VTRDPLYRKIEERLAGHLDPEIFEKCACALIRKDFPATVPVPGGGDSGTDGVVLLPDGQKAAIVSTTSGDVIGNLTANLNQRKAAYGPGAVVLTTSQELSATRRRNLEDRARELGFDLVQIYSRAAISERLYRDAAWRMELLGVPGDPPALSVLPPSTRPTAEVPLVGREEELRWLRETAGDLLLVGQPGSGKTFLLQVMAREDQGLFLTSEDETSIADALRELEPPAVFVDDAHRRPDKLSRLRWLRESCGAHFRIVATSWPSGREPVVTELALAESITRSLSPLTRDEIVEVVHHIGVRGPTELVREIVDQARGLPGRAATLAWLCLSGDVRGVALGTALRTSVKALIEQWIGMNTLPVLASFGLGGDRGVSARVVAAYLQMGMGEIAGVLVHLGAAGLLVDKGGGTFSVEPETLRHALVGTVFFEFPAVLDPWVMESDAVDRTEFLRTLIGAAKCGARLDDDRLADAVRRAGSIRIWEDYAWLGEKEARRALAESSEISPKLAWGALSLASDTAIDLLLRQASGIDASRLPSGQPMRLLEQWVETAPPGTKLPYRRRRAVLEGVRRGLQQGLSVETSVKALRTALSTRFQRSELDAGAGRTVTIEFAPLALEQYVEIAKLWPEAIDVLRRLPSLDFRQVLSAVMHWIHLHPTRTEVSPDVLNITREVARNAIRDLVAAFPSHQGLRHRLRDLARGAGFDLPPPLDPEFSALYPERNEERGAGSKQVREQAAITVAERWVRRQACEIASLVARFEEEAASAGVVGEMWVTSVMARIAEKAEQPVEWARELFERGVGGHLILPFLEGAALSDEPGWEGIAREILDDAKTAWVPATVVLHHRIGTAALRQRVIEGLGRCTRLVEHLIRSGAVASETVVELLTHADPGVAESAASEIWFTKSEDMDWDEEVLLRWRQFVVRCRSDPHWLIEALQEDRELTIDWLLAWIREANLEYRAAGTAAQLVASLAINDRRMLLAAIPADLPDADFVAALVGDDLDLYRDLLSRGDLKPLHLAPLRGSPAGRWQDKAREALKARYLPEDLVDASLSEHSWGTGPFSAYWNARREGFERLREFASQDLEPVARLGAERCEREYDLWRRRERQEAVYGR
jgi:hypothetical protein